MRYFSYLALIAMSLSACKPTDHSIEVSQTRPLTLFDQKRPHNVKDHPPLTWRALPDTEFRSLNYRAGKNESVEIYLSYVQGDLLQNANRWLGQFGAQPIDAIEKLPTIDMLGRKASLVEAKGDFNGGMGQASATNQALLGVLLANGQSILTIKAVGPSADVIELREDFFTYVESLEFATSHLISPKK